MFSFWGLLYLLFITAALAYFSYALFFRKEELQDSTPVQTKIQYLKKHVPPTSSNGWQLQTVDCGLRVWQKNMSSSSPLWIPETIYACSGIIPASQQEVINVLKQPSLLKEWDPIVKTVSKVTLATNNDVISVSFNCTSFIARAVQQIRQAFGEETKATYSRHWNVKPTPAEAWFISSFSNQVVPAEGALWSCFLVSSVDNVDDGQTDSLLTLVVGPVSPMFASIPRLTASRVAGLQDFFTHYKPDTSSVGQSHNTEASITTLSSPTTGGNADLDNRILLDPAESCKSEAMTATAPSSAKTDDSASLQMFQETEHTLPGSSHLPDFASSPNLENMIQKLITMYEGTEGTDGWISVAKFKGVDILKRPAQAGERPWDTLKGTSVVCVPIHYVLGYINSMDYRGEWDDLFQKGEILEEYEPLTLKLTRTEYKPIWPTSPRDFCTLVHLRQLSEAVFCMAFEAVEHEKCPERKGLVRADIVVGGFVVKELNTDPPSCIVTYITRVDLKGNLPIRLVNKVTSSQPQAVAALRDKLEALYKADLASNSVDMSQIGKEGVDLWRKLTRGKEDVREDDVREEKDSVLEASPMEKGSEKGSPRSPSLSSGKIEESNITDSGEVFPITDDNMQLPFVDRQNIDFRTLGSQAVANLLGEVLLANQVEIPASKELSDDLSPEGEWSYQGTEKDVAILRKSSPGQKIQSFLGKGIIKLEPPAVWKAIRNHMTRHVYDKMLKKIQVVRQIDEESKILYLHLQARQCILKQTRDFVTLTMDREESQKYVQASVSVQLPELPPSKDIIRAKVHCCGWIIEPFEQNGQLHSMVSYLVQVDFGGVVPAMLMNLVARRQPLCIAYLRDYLEKSQD